MNLKNLLFGVLIACFVVMIQCNKSTHKNLKKRLRQSKGSCRCKKIYKQVSADIDLKFKRLEHKLLMNYPQSDQATNVTGKYRDLDTQMGRLHGDVQNAKEALLQESRTLRKVKEQLRNQQKSMDSLNGHFGQLENIVKNLSDVIGRLDKIAPSYAMKKIATEVMSSTQQTTTTEKAVTTKSESLRAYPRHCHDVYKHGGLRYQGDYYIMVQPEKSKEPFKVVCKPIENTGGWTVIQRRQDGSVDFYKNWKQYKQGFGYLSGEFWLGNDNIFELTNQGPFKLRIDMEEMSGKKHYAIYDYFRIENESENYRLHVRGYHGNAGDSLTSSRDNHNGNQFSTHDRDNDRRGYNNCAEHYRGGWWYSDCYDSNLNGRYYTNGNHVNYFKRDGIHWNSINMHSSLKFVEMSIRPAEDSSVENNV